MEPQQGLGKEKGSWLAAGCPGFRSMSAPDGCVTKANYATSLVRTLEIKAAAHLLYGTDGGSDRAGDMETLVLHMDTEIASPRLGTTCPAPHASCLGA